MSQSPIAGRGRDDRLSHLEDAVLGHILSFLDGVEVGRATALSRRWRDVLAIVHTFSLEQPEPDAVTGALFARSRRPWPAPAAVPLRALRVSKRFYRAKEEESTVDQWVSYALKHAAPGLELDLRLSCLTTCKRPNVTAARPEEGKDNNPVLRDPLPKTDVEDDDDSLSGLPDEDDDGDDVGSSSEEIPPHRLLWDLPYTVPWGLFSCAALRSLRLGFCRLSPPAAFNMPSIETLHLTHVLDEEEHVQRLISACPRLADLALEACGTLTTLSLLHNTRLRGLALRCCHMLATVAVNASELCSFQYRGAVPGYSFITVGGDGGGGFPSVTSCKVDICTVCVEQATSTSEEELVKLGSFLHKFASAERLHLCSSSRMGSCFQRLPAYQTLRHLQLHGSVTHDDNPAVAAADISSILGQAPNLETLSLIFEVKRRDYRYCYKELPGEAELLDAHHLHYNQYDTLNVPAASVPVPPCLGSRVRKINLLHYQGGRAQRTLARFLLRNALRLEKLYCGFAQGPLWIQAELMREMEGWVANETASMEFR